MAVESALNRHALMRVANDSCGLRVPWESPPATRQPSEYGSSGAGDARLCRAGVESMLASLEAVCQRVTNLRSTTGSSVSDTIGASKGEHD